MSKSKIELKTDMWSGVGGDTIRAQIAVVDECGTRTNVCRAYGSSANEATDRVRDVFKELIVSIQPFIEIENKHAPLDLITDVARCIVTRGAEFLNSMWPEGVFTRPETP